MSKQVVSKGIGLVMLGLLGSVRVCIMRVHGGGSRREGQSHAVMFDVFFLPALHIYTYVIM